MDKIGGYRLVRKLGEGDRATVWLGHAGDDSGETSAIKVYRDSVSVADIDREIDALTRASSAHLVELTDIATAPDGRPCVVLRRIDGPSLAQVLERRSSLSAGEVVTVLAPVTAALAELHRVAVSHGGLFARSVLLDQRGAPVLAGFGRAKVVGPLLDDPSPLDPRTAQSLAGQSLTAQSLTPAARDTDPLLRADVKNLVALMTDLLLRCPDEPALGELRVWAEELEPLSGALLTITDCLFDLAPATPLRLQEPEAVARVAFPPRSMVSPIADDLARPIIVAGWLDESPLTAVQRVLRQRLGGLFATVRKPVWVAGAVGLVALFVAFAIIPSVGTARGAQALTSARPTPTTSAVAMNPGSGAGAESAAALAGDDPVAATTALVSLRAGCITHQSVACLATIEQAGSAALEADSYFLRQLQGGGTIKDRRLDGSQSTLVQRLGDSAIVGLGVQIEPGSFTASVLVVKLDAGWRIRDLTTGVTS